MSNLKAKITQANVYDIEINGVTHKGFEKVGELEGLTSLKNVEGQTVVVSIDGDRPVTKLFNEIFGKGQSDEFDVIKMSPDLIPAPEINIEAEESIKESTTMGSPEWADMYYSFKRKEMINRNGFYYFIVSVSEPNVVAKDSAAVFTLVRIGVVNS